MDEANMSNLFKETNQMATAAPEDKECKRLVNRIFAKKGVPKVTNFAKEFSDGSK